MLDSIMDKIVAWKNNREYKKNFQLSKKLSLVSELLFQDNKTDYKKTPHPLMMNKVSEFKFHIKNILPKNKPVHINFGDSLTDLSREHLKDIDGIYSISGSWSNHIAEVIGHLTADLQDFNIEKISIGCLGGNPLLAYQNYNETVNDAIRTLNLLKVTFPKAKIVVYGLPPVFNIHVTENTYLFDASLDSWCNFNKAKFISLKKEFGWLFPSTKWSSDGVHFNPTGAKKFNQLLREA